MYELFERAVRRLGAYRTAIGAIVAMIIKGSGALLTVAVFTLAARAMSADEFGRLAIWFSALGFLGITAAFGQDTLIARSFGEYAGKNDYGQAWSAYRFGCVLTVASGAIFAIGVLTMGSAVFPEYPRSAVAAAAIFLFTQTLLHYSSHSSRVIVGFVVSEFTRDVLWRLVLLAVVIWEVMARGLTLQEFFLAAAIGQILSIAVATYFVRPISRSSVAASSNPAQWRLWLSRSLPMWQSAILEAANLYVDVLLIGYVASPTEAGSYFAAARIANVFLMVSGSMNTSTFAHSANLYYSGQTQKLQNMLRSLVTLSTATLAPMLLLIYVFGGSLLTIFGSRYASDYQTLVVLATGCFLMSACGWPSVVLLTTGQEKIYSRIMAVAMFARIALTALLGWRFGALGAAWGWALVNVPLFALLSAICWRRIGVHSSILSLVGPAREKLQAAVGGLTARGRSTPTQG